MNDFVKPKVDYVLAQEQTREHACHWTGCKEQVPPSKWGCKKHWFKLPSDLREKIWATYRPGQEVDLKPSAEYVEVAKAVQAWIGASTDTKNRLHAAGLIRRLRLMHREMGDNLLGEAADALECSFIRENAILERYSDLVDVVKKAGLPTN